MKLVEILARELEVWPDGVHMLDQASDGHVCRDYYFFLADDWHSATVTRPQWQAERDRMKAMEAPKNTRTQDELIAEFNAALSKPIPLEKTPEPTYEQQLWDRVASRRFDCDRAIGVGSGHAARNAYEDADAFMAERARRVGK